MKLFFGAIGPTDPDIGPLGASNIGEMGVFNGPAGSDMLNRENFINNKLTRTLVGGLTQYNAVFIFSCVIEFCSVA